jgi:hypothetical protein
MTSARKEIYDQTRHQVGIRVWDKVEDQAWGQIKDQVLYHKMVILHWQVWTPVTSRARGITRMSKIAAKKETPIKKL